MVREIITINVGGCGVSFGDVVWKQYCSEHGVTNASNDNTNGDYKVFFEESNNNKFKARNLMIDTDPNCIDVLKNTSNSNLYYDDCLISGNDDCETNYAAGYHGFGSSFWNENIENTLNKQIEACDNFGAFIFNHSMSGGTGSGLTAYIMEQCGVNYKKKHKIGFQIFPFNTNHPKSSKIYEMELLNTFMSIHMSLEHQDLSIWFDNNRLYNMCTQLVAAPGYNDMNILLSKVHSSLTYSLRYSEFNPHLEEFIWSVVPNPRLHFVIPSMAPIVGKGVGKIYKQNAIGKMLCDGFVKKYYNYNVELLQHEPPLYAPLMQLIYCSYADINLLNKKHEVMCYNLNDCWELWNMCYSLDEYIMFDIVMNWEELYGNTPHHASMAMTVRGHNISEKILNDVAVKWKTHIRPWPFMEGWLSTFRIYSLGSIPSVKDDIIESKDSVVILRNHTTMSMVLKNKILNAKLDELLTNEKYTNLYQVYGMELDEFEEAKKNLDYLTMDYLDMISENVTDEDSDEDSDF